MDFVILERGKYTFFKTNFFQVQTNPNILAESVIIIDHKTNKLFVNY